MQQSTFNASFLAPIAIGSALGGVARYAMTAAVNDRIAAAFPFGTMSVNIVGCVLFGVFYQLAMQNGRMSPPMQVMLTTGFCGGFTTFSTFSYESVRLMQEGLWARTIAYVACSVVLGFGAFWGGSSMVRALASVQG